MRPYIQLFLLAATAMMASCMADSYDDPGTQAHEVYGNQSLTENKQTWSRCPNGTGKFMIADKTLGTKNPDTGAEDPTVVQ